MRTVKLLRIGFALLLSVSLVVGTPRDGRAAMYSPPWVDVFGSQWNDLDTTGAALDFAANFSTGYDTSVDLNKTAAISMGSLYAQSDAIWVAFGHASPGLIGFCYPAGGATCTTVVRSNFDCAVSGGVCLSAYGTTIHHIKLMVFAGCHTAKTPSTGRTLGSQAVNYNGVDSALAFNDLIFFGGVDRPDHYWAIMFAHRLSVGDTVSAAAVVAAQNVVFNSSIGSSYGWGSQLVWAPETTVMPPAYGS